MFNRRFFRHFRTSNAYRSWFEPRLQDFNNLPIGIFDSGVGGLTVLCQLRKTLPNESFLYFGDTANVPYGGRTPEELLTFTRNILNWMRDQPIKMAIMACNTSSAWALEHIRHEYPFPILGIILPGAKAAAQCGQRIGVIATQGTVDSNCYVRAIQEVNPKISVFQMACPEFVPLVERGRPNDGETHQIIQLRLTPLIESNIEALVYGCTHYPHLSSVIQQILPTSIKLIDPAIYVAKAAQQELHLLRLEAYPFFPMARTSQTNFFVSGCPESFAQQTHRLTQETIRVQPVDLSQTTAFQATASQATSSVMF